MTDQSGPQPQNGDGDGDGKTIMYRPSAEGGLEAASPESADYRDQLQSRRWDAAPLQNPEVEKTDPRLAVAGLVVLSALTLIVLVLGYGAGIWSLPA